MLLNFNVTLQFLTCPLKNQILVILQLSEARNELVEVKIRMHDVSVNNFIYAVC